MSRRRGRSKIRSKNRNRRRRRPRNSSQMTRLLTCTVRIVEMAMAALLTGTTGVLGLAAGGGEGGRL